MGSYTEYATKPAPKVADNEPTVEENLENIRAQHLAARHAIAEARHALSGLEAQAARLAAQEEAITAARGHNVHRERLEAIELLGRGGSSAHDALEEQIRSLRQRQQFIDIHIMPLRNTLIRLLREHSEYLDGVTHQVPPECDASQLCRTQVLEKYGTLFPHTTTAEEKRLVLQDLVDTYCHPDIARHITVDYRAANPDVGTDSHYVFVVSAEPGRELPPSRP